MKEFYCKFKDLVTENIIYGKVVARDTAELLSIALSNSVQVKYIISESDLC